MIDLQHGAYAARVNPHGGGLASLTYDGRDLVVPQDGMGGPPGFRGAVLAPWSNRIGDGRYRFDDVEQRLPITEPERGNALHGLVLDSTWQPDATSRSVTLTLRLGPVSGYPFWLDLALTYTLSKAGLAVELEAVNTGDTVAPYGCGFHPYVLPGSTETVDDAVVELDASQRLVTDPARLLPTGREPNAGSAYDFSTPTTLGDLSLDDAFTGVGADADGLHRLRIGDAEVWWDATLRWVQLFTPADRSALAIEPCTAPPDAFRTGDDLVRLAPGASHRARWGVGHRGAEA